MHTTNLEVVWDINRGSNCFWCPTMYWRVWACRHAGPVKAYVPQSTENGGVGGKKNTADLTIGDLKREDEHAIKVEATNRLPLHTGRWRLQSASNQEVAQASGATSLTLH